MSYQIDEIREAFSRSWRFDNMLGGSVLARIFPNQLLQDGGQLNSIVKFPVMTEAITQESWNQKTGFNETDSTEKIVEVSLETNFTVYTKIAKVNVPSDATSWAYGKQVTITNQEAEEVDEFILKKLCSQIQNKLENPLDLSVSNLYAEIQRLEKQARTLKFKLKNALIFISPKVNRIIVQNNIASGAKTIEGVNVDIYKIFGKYSVVEMPIDDYGFDMIAVVPSAFAFASAIETPLQAGEYTQGAFYGQIFVVLNRFYGANTLMTNQILGYASQGQQSPISTRIQGTDLIDNSSLINFKNMKRDYVIESYKTNSNFESKFTKFEKLLEEAKNVSAVENVVKRFEEIINK